MQAGCTTGSPTGERKMPDEHGRGRPSSWDPRVASVTRRQAVAGIGAAAAGGLLANGAEAASAAAGSGIYVVVDAGGGGDYTDLEQAVKEVPQNTTILVKRGTYVVTGASGAFGALNPAAGVRLIGEGYGSYIRLADGANTSVFGITNPNVVLENLRIDGNQANQAFASGDTVAFGPTPVDGGIVSRCHITGANGYNLVAFSGCTRMLFSENIVYDSRKEGIELHGAFGCTIVGNVVRGAGVNGILLWVAGQTASECAYNTVV